MVQHHRTQSATPRHSLTTRHQRLNRSTQEKLDRPAATSRPDPNNQDQQNPTPITKARRWIEAKPRLTPTELVERYGVRNDAIRGLLVEYLTEREASCDYTTLTATALNVVNLFGVDLEAHEPALRTLNVSTEQIRAWKQRLKTQKSGKQRTDWPTVVRTVRSFYLDLAAWAQDDPARWAPWVAPCPISNREIRTLAPRRRRRQIATMNARTRPFPVASTAR